MSDTKHDHASFRPKSIQKTEQMSPMRQGMRVTFRISAIDLFNAADIVLSAQVIPDQSFQPVERIDHNGLIFMRLGEQRVQISDNIIKRCGQREFVAVNLSQSIFGLNEDRSRALRSKRRLADAFGAVQHKSRGKWLLATLDLA
jgi:hypothetical protein